MNEHLQELFYKANAADYPEKRGVFYPLKDKLLRLYGKHDGWDLQVIEKKCWGCDGTGIDDWNDGCECYACQGTGIYSTRNIRLDRYQLGLRIYHIPQSSIDVVVVGYKTHVKGLIQHEAIAPEEGQSACFTLLNWWSSISQTSVQKPPKEYEQLSLLDQVLVAELMDEDGQCRAAVLGTPHRQTLPQSDRVCITYTNWKGETGDRTIKPIEIWFGSTQYHPEEQWLLHAWDEEKSDFRQFAMKDIKAWREEVK